MVFYQQIITLKSIFSWKNKSGKVLSFLFVGAQNDQIAKKKRTCAIISVFFISWFTSAVIESHGVITNRIKTTTVGSFVTLIDV